jgi:hypothetical protein
VRDERRKKEGKKKGRKRRKNGKGWGVIAVLRNKGKAEPKI